MVESKSMQQALTRGRRAAPLVFQEIQLLLQRNTPLVLADFDGLVRQFLHAIYSAGGMESLEDALESLHLSTERTPRKAVRNWSAYINTHLKKFFRGLTRAPTHASNITSDTVEFGPKSIAPVRRSRLNPDAKEFYPSTVNRMAVLGVIERLQMVRSPFWSVPPVYPPVFPPRSKARAFPINLKKVLATGISYAGSLPVGKVLASPSHASVSSLADATCKLQQEHSDSLEGSSRVSLISEADSLLCNWEMADNDAPEPTTTDCTDSEQSSLDDDQLVGSCELPCNLVDKQDGFIMIPSHPEDSISVTSDISDFVIV